MFFRVLPSFSQTWELGISAGGMGYQGDLNQHKFYKFNNIAFGGSVKRNFDGFWSLKLSVLNGKVNANDADSDFAQERERNLNFYSGVTEGSLLVEFNFFDYGLNFGQSRITPLYLQVYLFLVSTLKQNIGEKLTN
ncbi:hypothetical protein FYC62_01825 [Pedobacter aquae]|uniref:DUF6089 domain-containing protein n=1 Tax=Pedobacter aquae TaxID=2605747 RepID=A0A5C0VHP8_9SPHI|nr:DUF6089 family protein [Pedobacter aquae]QEK50544.1 hypothetical protein FYC62_01825 [Pedobacter aquae]